MLNIENLEVVGLRPAIRGMRNAMNSWDKSDSGVCKGGDNGIGCANCATPNCGHAFDSEFKVGKEDYALMQKLRNGGPDHRKYMRMIVVYMDITAPLYWWKEFDTYKVGTVANSCSTMHKIHAKEFTLEDFSHEHLITLTEESVFPDNTKYMMDTKGLLDNVIDWLNCARSNFLATNDKLWWWQMIQLLPSTYNQRRTIMLSYEVLANQYKSRVKIPHKLDEWHIYGNMIEALPYSGLITGNVV